MVFRRDLTVLGGDSEVTSRHEIPPSKSLPGNSLNELRQCVPGGHGCSHRKLIEVTRGSTGQARGRLGWGVLGYGNIISIEYENVCPV